MQSLHRPNRPARDPGQFQPRMSENNPQCFAAHIPAAAKNTHRCHAYPLATEFPYALVDVFLRFQRITVRTKERNIIAIARERINLFAFSDWYNAGQLTAHSGETFSSNVS